MSVLLVTLAIGHKYLEEYNRLFRKSQEDYAKKNNYDFKVITDYLNPMITHPHTISFNKILVCSQDWSTKYDYIIFVDADIFININSPPIHNYMDYKESIGIIDEYTQPTPLRRYKLQQEAKWETSGTEYYKLAGFDIITERVLNSGVLVMQPKHHKEFLENIYNTYVLKSINHKRGFHFEQSSIGYEILKKKLHYILPNKFNAIWSLHKLTDASLNIEDFFKNNYFIHFAGHYGYEHVISLQKINS
jgi:hypothetical protein